MLPRTNQLLSAAIKPHVPTGAYVRLVLPLSDTDTLTIYELGNWTRYWKEWEKTSGSPTQGEATDPDTRLLITRDGQPVFSYAFKDMHNPEGLFYNWGLSAVAMSAAHLCSDQLDVTYLVLQSGNSGGFFFAIHKIEQGYKLVAISDADQGRLVLSAKKPGEAEVWTAKETGVCGACSKPFAIKKMSFKGTGYQLISEQETRKRYSGFQDNPLLVKP